MGFQIFLLCRYKRRPFFQLHLRAVFLHGRDGSQANFKFIIEDENYKTEVRKQEDVLKSSKIQNHNSDLMKLLNPIVEQSVVTRTETVPPSHSGSDDLLAVQIDILGVIGSRPPDRIKFQILSSQLVTHDTRIGHWGCK